jgi:hypothetical protein
MREQLQTYTAWATVALLRAGEGFDVQLLQWPGGSVIAALVWAGARARRAVRLAMRLGSRWRKPGFDPSRRARVFSARVHPDGRSERSVASDDGCLHCSR